MTRQIRFAQTGPDPRIDALVGEFHRTGFFTARASGLWTLFIACMTAPFAILAVWLMVAGPEVGKLAVVLATGVPAAAGLAWVLIRLLHLTRVRVDAAGVHSDRTTVAWSEIREIGVGTKISRGPSADYASLTLIGAGFGPGREVSLPAMLTPSGEQLAAALRVLLAEYRRSGQHQPTRMTVWPVTDMNLNLAPPKGSTDGRS